MSLELHGLQEMQEMFLYPHRAFFILANHSQQPPCTIFDFPHGGKAHLLHLLHRLVLAEADAYFNVCFWGL
jgi:hypothetical protein